MKLKECIKEWWFGPDEYCHDCRHKCVIERNYVMTVWCNKKNRKINYSRNESCNQWEAPEDEALVMQKRAEEMLKPVEYIKFRKFEPLPAADAEGVMGAQLIEALTERDYWKHQAAQLSEDNERLEALLNVKPGQDIKRGAK